MTFLGEWEKPQIGGVYLQKAYLIKDCYLKCASHF